VPEELLEFIDFRVGQVEILLGVGNILSLQCSIAFCKIELCPLLSRSNIPTEAITGGSLLLAKRVDTV